MVDKSWVKAVRKEWWTHERNVALIEMVKHKPLLYDITSFQYNDMTARNIVWKEIGNHINTSAVRCRERWKALKSLHRKNLSKSKMSGPSKSKYQHHLSFLLPFMKNKQSLPFLDEGLYEGPNVDQYDFEIPIEAIKVEESSDRENEFLENGVYENVESSTRMQRGNSDQDAGVSTSTAEAFSEQFVKSKKNHFPSTSGVLQQYQENTSDASMKLPVDEKIYMSYRPVYPTAPDTTDQFFSLIATSVRRFSSVDQHILKSKIFNLVSSVEEKYLNQNLPHIVYSSSALPSEYTGACNSQTSVMCPESIHTSFPNMQCIQLNE